MERKLRLALAESCSTCSMQVTLQGGLNFAIWQRTAARSERASTGLTQWKYLTQTQVEELTCVGRSLLMRISMCC